MAFAILRMEKIKSAGSFKRALEHNTRERVPSNADPERLQFNKYEGGTADEIFKKFEEKMPGKVRKNAVLAVELVMTASHDFRGNWTDYLKDCQTWAEKIFGKENILSVAHHLDEKTPHLQILLMPLKDGKLNAKAFIGGSRDRMAELQDDFYKSAGFFAGLSRGKPAAETRARHTQHNMTDLDAREKKISEGLAENKHTFERLKAEAKDLNAREKELAEKEKELAEKLLSNEKLTAGLIEKEKGLADLQKQIAEGNGAINQILKMGFSRHWTQEFQKRVIDYAVKNFPKYFTECEQAVSHNADRKTHISQTITPSRGRS